VRADSRDKKGERSLVEWIKARGSIDTPRKVLKNERREIKMKTKTGGKQEDRRTT
jgi:hypothetical protein